MNPDRWTVEELYVDGRPNNATEDDDVRALEDVAAILHTLPAGERQRLRRLIGDRLSDAMGLSES